jgi:hypothetical protein
MERDKNMLEKFWKFYVGLGNGGFADFNSDPDPEADPDGGGIDPEVDPDPEPQPGNENEVEVNGASYTQDAEGNYLNAAGVAVLDSKQVPFFNRAREIDRKDADHKQELADLKEQHRLDIEAASKPAQNNPEDYDDATGLTFGQLSALDKRNANSMGNIMSAVDNRIADQQISGEKFRLQQNPQYKDFFANSAYVAEMDKKLANLSLQSASMPDIAEQVISMVQGRHIGDIVKNAEKRARTAALEGREIVSEVALGGSAGVNTSGKIVTRALMKEAGEMGVSVDSLLEIKEHKRKLKEASK